MPQIPDSECQKPGCTERGRETYKDANGNRLDVCAEHYYELVAGRGVVSITRSRDNEPKQGPISKMLFGSDK